MYPHPSNAYRGLKYFVIIKLIQPQSLNLFFSVKQNDFENTYVLKKLFSKEKLFNMCYN